MVEANLDDQRVKQLFAWLTRAFAGDGRYNNLMLAFAAIFGTHAPGTPYAELVDNALSQLPDGDDIPIGEPVSLRERERGSLGAMGAAQWTGQFTTRPHALLDVRAFSSVEEWVGGLPRGARRTINKALSQQGFEVEARPILGGAPAPHSTLSHFRCVVEHEVRLLAESPDEFFDALNQGVGRYINCQGQAGELREYRDVASGRVLAFSQEATKGRVMRGQWFYATDEASARYIWFHSVHNLVERAIADPSVDMVDLGPSGTDAFSALKEKYGFASVAGWHAVADYRGPFRYAFGEGAPWDELDPPDWLFEKEPIGRE